MTVQSLENFRGNLILMNSIKDGIMNDYKLLASLEALNENGAFSKAIQDYRKNWIESEIEEMKILSEELRQVTATLNSISDEIGRKILEFRYIHGLNMKQIEGKLHVSNRTLWRYFNKTIDLLVTNQ